MLTCLIPMPVRRSLRSVDQLRIDGPILELPSRRQVPSALALKLSNNVCRF